MIVALMDGVTYIRDGERCFFSETLRHELCITDGELTDVNGDDCFVTIDFQKELVRFKDPEDAHEGSLTTSMGFDRRKDIGFSDILEVHLIKPDGFKKEIMDKKFEVFTLKSKKALQFTAKTALERHIWH